MPTDTPAIVVDSQMLNQTAAIPFTTLFTPSANDDFLVTIVYQPFSDSAATMICLLQGKDDMGNNSFLQITAPNATTGISGVAALRFESTAPVQIFTQISTGSSPHYNLYVTITNL